MKSIANLSALKEIKTEMTRFMMTYQFALDEMNTKINILKDEFHYIHDYNPIEHTSSRLKTPESLFNKASRKKIGFSFPEISETIRDIAGIRITCSFKSDIYQISDMICNQKDVELIEFKDYIKNPKPNGYQSLHLIVRVPVFMTDRVEEVYVEIQIRTIAMDFWASLEHKIYYKYNNDIPQHLKDELRDAAISANELDEKMEALHHEVSELKENDTDNLDVLDFAKEQFNIPIQLLEMMTNHK